MVKEPEKVLATAGSPHPTSVKGISLIICSDDSLIALITEEVSDLEKTLLSALDSDKLFTDNSITEIGTFKNIFVFKPFEEKKGCEVHFIPKGLKEFVGKYSFVKTTRGWTLLNVNRVIAIPVTEE